MADQGDGKQTVVRTDRGLSIAGTRITLYAILDYLNADWPPTLIREWLNLTDEQMSDVLAYIAAHRDEIEQEYQRVVEQAEETRRYWEERNRNRLASRAPAAPTPDQASLRARFQAWKDKIDQA